MVMTLALPEQTKVFENCPGFLESLIHQNPHGQNPDQTAGPVILSTLKAVIKPCGQNTKGLAHSCGNTDYSVLTLSIFCQLLLPGMGFKVGYCFKPAAVGCHSIHLVKQ
jgi:hypothetical protein